MINEQAVKVIRDIIILIVICATLGFGIFSRIGISQLESTIRGSQSDLARINELEQRIAKYDQSIIDLEQREILVRSKYSDIELREAKLDIRSREITIAESDLVERKRYLEERLGYKLIELNNKIKQSRELIENIKNKYTNNDNSNSN